MKVCPEYFIQLSHRVNTLHREKENLLKVQAKRDRKVIESPSEKGQGSIVNPGQKTGLIFHMYANKPRSKDRKGKIPGKNSTRNTMVRPEKTSRIDRNESSNNYIKKQSN